MLQEKWYKYKRLIIELVDMEVRGKEGMDMSNMEYIRGFLV